MYWPKPGDGMQAIDTNVVVRYLTGDDPGQAAKARGVIEGQLFTHYFLTEGIRGTPESVSSRD